MSRRSRRKLVHAAVAPPALRAVPSLAAACAPPHPTADNDIDEETARLAEELALDIRTAPPPPKPGRERVKRAVRHLARIAPDITFSGRQVARICPAGGKTIWDALQSLVAEGVLEKVKPYGYRAAVRR